MIFLVFFFIFWTKWENHFGGRSSFTATCGGGGCLIEGEIGPPPLSPMSLDTARSNGLYNSKVVLRGGELNCRRRCEERCLVYKGSVTTFRGSAATWYMICGRLGTTAPTLPHMELFRKRILHVHEGSGGMLPYKGETGVT